jgi:hypothetical protein
MTSYELIEKSMRGVSILTNSRASLIGLARFLGVNKTTVHRWKNGETIPTRLGKDRMLEKLVQFVDQYDELKSMTMYELEQLKSNG